MKVLILATLLHASGAIKLEKLGRQSRHGEVVPSIFVAMPGNGLCAGNNVTDKARRLEEVKCDEAQALCFADRPQCVAYACSSERPLSVLYTTTGCTEDCASTDWQFDPTQITGSFVNSSDQTFWSNATCFAVANATG
eukprot:TRINITY_DN66716_c0_g1_i1.p1 TRINITY_DN66716_c0_g1~~TRINITY_DN66716_c0_g1_i1.p1  ORF type:complete len:138 (+),score=16.34 TRINITY_DN66716_c0_g1_i1:56-469(+)